MDKSDRPYWWEASAELLHTKPFLDEPGMGVTPAILKTSAVQDMLDYLSGFGTSWIEYLLASYKPFPVNLFIKKKVWTEYSLYHLYLKKHDLVKKYHTICDETIHTRLISENSAWYKEDFEKLKPGDIFCEHAPGIFCVLQSNMNLPAEKIRQKIKPVLDC